MLQLTVTDTNIFLYWSGMKMFLLRSEQAPPLIFNRFFTSLHLTNSGSFQKHFSTSALFPHTTQTLQFEFWLHRPWDYWKIWYQNQNILQYFLQENAWNFMKIMFNQEHQEISRRYLDKILKCQISFIFY